MERILEAITNKVENSISMVFNIYDIVYDGIYMYEPEHIESFEDSREAIDVYRLYLRFSFNTTDNDYGYLLFKYSGWIKGDPEDNKSIKSFKDTAYNPVRIADGGIRMKVISDLYKDNKGYYYITRAIINDVVVKVYLKEYQTLFIEFIRSTLDFDLGLPLVNKYPLPGWRLNTNELFCIHNIVSVNYMEENKDLIEIKGLHTDTYTFKKDKDNKYIKYYNYLIDCRIPTEMYTCTEECKSLANGLRFILKLEIPAKMHRHIKNNIKKKKLKTKDFINTSIEDRYPNELCYIMSDPIAYGYIKDNKKMGKIVVLLSSGGKYEDNAYIKFNMLTNYNAFITYFTDYLGITEYIREK